MSGGPVRNFGREGGGSTPPPRPLDFSASDFVTFRFAICYLPKPLCDPVAKLRSFVEGKFSDFRAVGTVAPSDHPVLSAHLVSDARGAYRSPDAEYLERFGRGLTAGQTIALANSRQAFLLSFGFPRRLALNGLFKALQLTSSLARLTGGVPCDEETGEVFSSRSWDIARILSWRGEVPDVSNHILVHTSNMGESGRSVTFGMVKFGLPDVVVSDFPTALARNVRCLMTLFAQALADGCAAAENGEFDLDIRAVVSRHSINARALSLNIEARAKALLALRACSREEIDPENRLVEIGFDRYSGEDLCARQESMFSAMFGWNKPVIFVGQDDRLLAAKQRAAKQIPALEAAFNRGLGPGEFIRFKVPVRTSDGRTEWVWAQVLTWRNGRIMGRVKREPLDESGGLMVGKAVEFSPNAVFDYILGLADGTIKRNEITQRLEKFSRTGELSRTGEC